MVLIRDACEMVSRSDRGCLRSLNEDVVRAVPDIGLVVVADGMGGHNAGDVAARMAVDVIEEEVRRALGVGPAQRAPADALRQAFSVADRQIRRSGAADRHLHQMGATVACVLLQDNRVHLAHVGDTRVYRLRDGRLQLLTRDHTLNQHAWEKGVVNEAELAVSRNRHLVTHALGASDEDSVELRELSTEPGDIFLVCSDGLNDMVDGADIELVLDTMRDNLPLAAEQLVMIARDCGGHDNISVALVRVDAPFSSRNDSVLTRLKRWFGRSA